MAVKDHRQLTGEERAQRRERDREYATPGRRGTAHFNRVGRHGSPHALSFQATAPATNY